MTTAKQNSKRKKGKRKEKQRKGKDIESRKEERSVVYRVPAQIKAEHRDLGERFLKKHT